MKNVGSILTLGVLLAPAALAGTATGADDVRQTVNRPTEDAWSGAVNRFARALTEGEDESAVLATLSDQHAIRRFEGQPGRIEDLAALARTARWSKAFWYGCVPDQFASDLATAVATDASVDAELRKFLTPASESARRTADVTAVKWIGATLAPRVDQPVGVIVLYHPPVSAAETAASRRSSVTVVLVSGERVGAKLYRVRNIAFGLFHVPDQK